MKTYFIIALLILSFAEFSIAECNRDQAFNKMMAFGRAKEKLQSEVGFTPLIAEMSKEAALLGKALAEEKYTFVCTRYDEIAQKYNLDIKSAENGLIKMEHIKKDGGKMGGRCTQAEAHQKAMDYSHQLQNLVALGEVDQSEISSYSDDVMKISNLLYSNPGEYCRKLDQLKVKYNLK
jgi:hypothetical protein